MGLRRRVGDHGSAFRGLRAKAWGLGSWVSAFFFRLEAQGLGPWASFGLGLKGYEQHDPLIYAQRTQ